MADIFQFEIKLPTSGTLVTVTKVNVTKDMSIARVYLSLFNSPDKEQLIEYIRNKTKEIRRILGNRTRNQLRRIPELEFYEDDSLDYIENIEKLLH